MVSKLLLITVVGRLRVIVCPDAEVIISLVVPAIVNDCEVLTVPVPLSPAMPISIPVRLAPLIAGSVAGNLPSGTVPEARSEASRLVRLAPLIAGKVPVRLAAGILPDPVILFPLRSKLPPS